MKFKESYYIWIFFAIIGVLVIILPLVFMFLQLLGPATDNWYNIRNYVLGDIIKNTLILTIFSAFFSAILGTVLAIIMSFYSFKGKKTFNILLILPLAIPSYIAAFTYSSLLGFTGFFQTFFRNSLGIYLPQTFLNIRNLRGAIFIFTITLYPYVYLIVRAFLENSSASMLENAKILGKSKFQTFSKIILPILLPSILGSSILVALEVLNDFGVSSYFGIRTFSTAIFQAWHGMFDINLAFRLSSTMLAFVLIFTLLLKYVENNKKYQVVSSKEKKISLIKLEGKKAFLAFFICFFVAFISFILPIMQMLVWTNRVWDSGINTDILIYTKNTILISVISTIIILIFNLILANVSRLSSKKMRVFLKISSIGYMIPSAVLAISTISLFIFLERMFFSGSSIFTSSLVMLIFAYFVKYFLIGFQSIEEGFSKVGNTYTESSRVLGFSITKTFFKVDIFTIKAFILSGGILVFLDIVKELPLALTLRTFNFQTLPTRVYMFAMNEQIAESAPYSLVIIFISSIFIIFTYKLKERMVGK